MLLSQNGFEGGGGGRHKVNGALALLQWHLQKTGIYTPLCDCTIQFYRLHNMQEKICKPS